LFPKIVAVFIIVPILEMYMLIEIGRWVGALPTIGLVVLTGLVGVSLARAQGFAVLSRLRKNLDSGIAPTDELLSGVIILGGALLLLTPGLITDTIGFILLIPYSRSYLVTFLKRYITNNIRWVNR
jgi:UPF0716 protein FxsA